MLCCVSPLRWVLHCVRRAENMPSSTLLAILISHLFFSLLYITTAGDTIGPNRPIKDGGSLISAGGAFELGFFSPNGSSKRYLGIWYKNIPDRQVVWVANREAPIAKTTGVVGLTRDGNLAISDQTNKVMWSTNTSSSSVSNPIVQLMDNGNLILNSSKGLVWQSFDHPSDTLLPGMKLGRNYRSNKEWYLTSWKSASDPSPGPYTCKMDTQGPPEIYLRKESALIRRSGTWNGQGWDGLPGMRRGNYFGFHLVSNHDELYYYFELINKSIISSVVLNQNGVNQRLLWLDNHWLVYWQFSIDPCDTYATCGKYGVCMNDGSPNCKCLKGFEPRSPELWALRDWVGDCARRVPLDCGMGDGFVKVTQLKLPDTSNTTWDSSKSLDECRDWCLHNCSCLAFALMSPDGGGCINWFGDLIDIREFTDGGDDLYVRLAASELDESLNPKKKLGRIISIPVSSGVILIAISACMLWKKHRKATPVLAATDELADITMMDSEIGEGGFGPVYKGMLPNGQEIAVKRLSKGSVQGIQEFKNEIKLIVNFQHKNLVRLLGSCIRGEERMLVYEYMPNRSLDCFLFDPIRAALLDWERRRRVIHGVAQGLLYLHNYSRLRIIHRDLKPSNILLDSDMNPKISDFGIARIFGGNQDKANTDMVVGTYGYMPLEYAVGGLFSEKSDVFSFGVLLLEIVSGKKNRDLHEVGDSWFLLGHAWELWKGGQISDPSAPIHEGNL